MDDRSVQYVQLDRSQRKKCNCGLLVTCVIMGVALVIAILTAIGLAVSFERVYAKNKGVCSTPECVELGSQILSSLDQSVDPCDDFYKFACSGYIEEEILPYGVGRDFVLGSPRRLNIERIRFLMESNDTMGVAAVRKAITYYQSCLKGDTRDTAVQAFKETLLQKLGGWPLVRVNGNTEWNINSQQGFLQEVLYGSSAFFSLIVFTDPLNASRNVFTVSPGGLTIAAPSVYTSDFFKDLLKKMMVSAFFLLDSSVPNTTYSAVADDIINFESSIATFSGDVSLSSITPTSYYELSSMFPQFNWQENALYYASLANINLDVSTPVNVLSSDYLRSLSSLVSRTDPTILENYAKWHLLYSLMPYMSEEFFDVFSLIETTLDPENKKPQRYVTCVNNEEQQLSLLVARVFTETYLPHETRANLSLILKDLENALRERIGSRDWLDDTTRQRALKKLSSIRELVAYPDQIFNNTFLNDFYFSLEVSTDTSYLLNQAASLRFNSLKTISRADRFVINNRSMWYLTSASPPTTTNAAYYPLSNQIYIFEGILDTPVFDAAWPDYFKYGTVGWVVGHEYTHGFDNSGRNFDEVGNLVNWWTRSSEVQFSIRAQCFIDQYNKYTIPAGQVNGTLTLGENIADNGGLKAAYQAYKNRGENGQTLPGLSYNADQLFFIGGAQLWCGVATKMTQKNLLRSDPHSPNSIRPLGAFSNNQDFASAFSCPEGSRLNPRTKCELW